jgi:GNAT superfamily N-acetyltransferase
MLAAIRALAAEYRGALAAAGAYAAAAAAAESELTESDGAAMSNIFVGLMPAGAAHLALLDSPVRAAPRLILGCMGPVGVVGVAALRDAGAPGGARGEVRALYVVPEARRLGCARELLTAAEIFAAARGFRELVAAVPRGFAADALPFYERAGFTPAEAALGAAPGASPGAVGVIKALPEAPPASIRARLD